MRKLSPLKHTKEERNVPLARERSQKNHTQRQYPHPWFYKNPWLEYDSQGTVSEDFIELHSEMPQTMLLGYDKDLAPDFRQRG